MSSNAAAWLPGSSFVVAGLCLATSARAAVVWTSTFENGDLSEWKPGVNGTNGARQNVVVLGDHVYSGKLAAQITVHPDDTAPTHQNRVDIQHPSTLTDEGKDSWLSGHYLMLVDAQVRDEIAFYESFVSYQNMMDFWVAPKAGGGTTINFGVGGLGATKLWTADFSPGVWHQLGIHVHWSTDAQKGSVEAWFDGAQVVMSTHAKTKADGNALFFQTGLHRSELGSVTETLYIDDFVEADAFADARIAAPNTNPVGGAGGTGGGASGGAGGASASAAGAASGGGGGGAAGGGGSSPSGGAGSTSVAGSTSAAGTGEGGGANAASSINGADPSGCACATATTDRDHTGAASLASLLGFVAVFRRRWRRKARLHN